MKVLQFAVAWVFIAAVLLVLTSGKRTPGWIASVLIMSAILAAPFLLI